MVPVSSSSLQMLSSSSSKESSPLPSSSPSKPPQDVLIVGAGIMGCTTAYYLAKEFGISSTLANPMGTIAPAARGTKREVSWPWIRTIICPLVHWPVNPLGCTSNWQMSWGLPATALPK
jgi:hypothetical protein